MGGGESLDLRLAHMLSGTKKGKKVRQRAASLFRAEISVALSTRLPKIRVQLYGSCFSQRKCPETEATLHLKPNLKRAIDQYMPLRRFDEKSMSGEASDLLYVA